MFCFVTFAIYRYHPNPIFLILSSANSALCLCRSGVLNLFLVRDHFYVIFVSRDHNVGIIKMNSNNHIKTLITNLLSFKIKKKNILKRNIKDKFMCHVCPAVRRTIFWLMRTRSGPWTFRFFRLM